MLWRIKSKLSPPHTSPGRDLTPHLLHQPLHLCAPATSAFLGASVIPKLIPTLQPLYLRLPLPRMFLVFISLTVITSKMASLNFQCAAASPTLAHHHIASTAASPSRIYALQGQGFFFSCLSLYP